HFEDVDPGARRWIVGGKQSEARMQRRGVQLGAEDREQARSLDRIIGLEQVAAGRGGYGGFGRCAADRKARGEHRRRAEAVAAGEGADPQDGLGQAAVLAEDLDLAWR